MNKVIVTWINRTGQLRKHTLFNVESPFYAQNWWRENIAECQGVLTPNERQTSQLKYIDSTSV
jgi:hypothetical protein